MSYLVQYVIVRGDLIKTLNWPLGAVIAQACHAVTAVNHIFTDDLDTVRYLQDINNMHKVVLECPDAETMQKLSLTLQENGILHKLWIEQPESIPTCLAIKPYQKDKVQAFVKKFKLFK